MLGIFRKLGFYNHAAGLESNSMIPQLKPMSKSFAPGTQIPYDPALIGNLKKEHEKLLHLFAGMMRNAQDLDLGEAGYFLNEFESTFNNYILLELTRLYVYLDCCLKSDPDNRAVIQDFRKKMNSVSRLVRAFLRRWKGQINPETASDFLNHSKQVGQLLFARTKAEAERLYNIYERCPDMLMQHQQGGRA